MVPLLGVEPRCPDWKSGGRNRCPTRAYGKWSGWQDLNLRASRTQAERSNQAELHPENWHSWQDLNPYKTNVRSVVLFQLSYRSKQNWWSWRKLNPQHLRYQRSTLTSWVTWPLYLLNFQITKLKLGWPMEYDSISPDSQSSALSI